MEQTYLPATVRDRIQDQLKERKITQGELATEIGISESALSRFLSGKTDKIGDDYIVKIADFLGVSTDFILGQTDFPERRNYEIEELSLSYKAAMVLYTREVETDVVNRILENPRFPEITRMIARYFKDSIAEPYAGAKCYMEYLTTVCQHHRHQPFGKPAGGRGGHDTNRWYAKDTAPCDGYSNGSKCPDGNVDGYQNRYPDTYSGDGVGYKTAHPCHDPKRRKGQ